MKICLRIAAGSGTPTTFEHAGPVVRIGRDPDCELSLQGEASTAVSRQHARIELGAGGATLTDLGSSNGTLLNDELLKEPAPLRVGDRIQLGYTGATLTVRELDLEAPPVGHGSRRPPLLWIGSGAAVALVAVLVIGFWPRQPKGQDEDGQDAMATASGVRSPDREKSPPTSQQAPPTGEQTSAAPIEDYEALARGLVHEAFAQPIDYQPQPGTVVPREPPAPIDEVAPEQKPDGDDVQWLSGYWAWDDDRTDYLWVSGLWRDAPPERHWVPGAWQEVEGGWMWSPGFWASDETEEVTYIRDLRPSVETAPSGPAPRPTDVYAPGTWVYQEEEWFWRPGYWVSAQPGWVWVMARYVWTPGGYVFVDGYWDYPLERRGLLSAPVRVLRRSVTDWTYRPRFVVGVDFLLGAMFVGPGRRHYHFGDYFEARDAQRGFVAFLDHRPTPLSNDPIYSHYRQVFADDPAWERDLRKLYHARSAGTMARPPHTWRQQERAIADLTAKRTAQAHALQDVRFTHAQGVTALTRVAELDRESVTRLASLAPRAKVGPAHAIKAHPLKQEERKAEQAQTQQRWQVAQMRREYEAKLLQQGANHGHAAPSPMAARLALPHQPVVRRPATVKPPQRPPAPPRQHRPPPPPVKAKHPQPPHKK
jgi:hypothetical protein